jgi:catechol 2,3-dioxygenase-like lactoylglutathione lyase family enzyme
MTLPALGSHLHHIGIQTRDLANSLAWYQDFFGCRPTWTAETFSELTHRRLPGVVRLTEVVVGDLRLHLFERAGLDRYGDEDRYAQFQHLCVAVASEAELRRRRDRWSELFRSGRYRFADSEPPTEIVVDERGVQSFYCVDVDGLEFEFTYLPKGVS